MTEPAAAIVPAAVADPARAAEAQASLRQLLRLVNILSGCLPGPNMGRDGTRDVIVPRLQAVQASLVAAGAEPLLVSRCTSALDFFEGGGAGASVERPTSSATITTTPAAPVIPPATGTGPTTTTVMGAPASMADRASLAADALALAERQALAVIAWGASNAASLGTWWAAFETAMRSLIDGVRARGAALAGALTDVGRNLRDFFAAWAVEAQRRFDSLVTALGIGAGLGAGAGILFLAFLLMMAVRSHT